jgi:hypothetical protein
LVGLQVGLGFLEDTQWTFEFQACKGKNFMQVMNLFIVQIPDVAAGRPVRPTRELSPFGRRGN